MRARDKILRKVIFDKATSKSHLKDWIQNFLEIDMPDSIVCDENIDGHEPSNSSPMDLIWEVYNKALKGDDGNFQKVLVYAARDSYKTVSASILELLCLFHLNRNVAHMAAIEAQAAKCQEYLSKYIEKPILRDFVTSKNKRTIEITRFVSSATGKIISPREWDAMPIQERDEYVPHSNYMKILVATMSGANCVHPETLVSRWDGQNVQAQMVKPNDLLKTFDYHTLEFIPVMVGAVSETRKQAREFIFSDGSNLVVSDDHKVFTNKGWRCASKVKLGDKFTEFPNAPYSITFSEPTGVYPKPNVRQVILGTLLGDASLTSQNGKGVRYSVSHCSVQYLYLQRIQDIFVSSGIESKVIVDGAGHKLFTKMLPIFDEWYRKLYTPNKRISLDILNELTWEGVAYWFMDDVRGNPIRVGSGKDHRFELATCGFTLEENEVIAKWFNDKGIECKVDSVTNQSRKVYPIIKFTLEASRKLSELIGPYFVPSMRYKLLPPLGHDETVTLDTGEKKMEYNRAGFVWSDSNFVNTPKQRKWMKQLKSKLQAEVIQINLVGEQKLVDIHIATDNPHHQSFLANSWKLVHNSEHVPFMVLDELDLAPEKPIEEAKMIPSTGPNGELPITFMISSRKSNHGPVQKELDRAVSDPKNTTQIRHWNILDVSMPCPSIKHLPEEPKIPIYVNESTFAAIPKEEFLILSDEERLHYREHEGYVGCLQNCALFAACKGRLAKKQTSTSSILKPLAMVTETFRNVTPETAQAQLMCWKPSSIGSIYPYFSREQHMVSANKMMEMIEGSTPHGTVSKPELIETFKKRGWTFHLGMDFGFTHNFAAVLGVTDGYRVFIIDVMAVAGLELNEKVEACKSKYLSLSPMVYPDPAYPSDIKTFRKNGFRCKSFEKDVLLGIDAVRSKLMPGLNKPPELYLLAGDAGCELLAKRLTEYHWAMDASGEVTDQPDKKNDDECDALRYLFQNLFGKGGKLVIAAQESGNKRVSNPYSKENWMRTKIQELTTDGSSGPIRGKKGSFIFDM